MSYWQSWRKIFHVLVMAAMALSLLASLGSIAYAEEETPVDPPETGEVSEPEDGGGSEPGEEEVATGEEVVPAPDDLTTDPEGVAAENPDPASDEAESSEAVSDPGSDSEAAVVEMEDQAASEADGQSDEAQPMETQEATSASADPDPYFTIAGTTHRYSGGATYCADNYPGDPNCNDNLGNPLQSAINFFTGTALAPTDSTIYVEDGSYGANATVDGSNWTVTPVDLILSSLNGSSLTTITGTLTIQNMLNFILRGFTVTAGITADNNTGTLTMQDVVADNTAGTGITVDNHDGEVVLENVQANGNQNNGAYIDNTAGTAGVTVSDSTFNDNNTTAAGGQQAGLEVHSNGEVVLNNVEASGNLDGDGASLEGDGVTVNYSTFNNNTSPSAGYGNGLAAQSSDRPIVLHGVVATSNEESGAILWFPVAAADPTNIIRVRHSQLKYNGQFGVWAQPENGTVTFECLCTSGNAFGSTLVPVGEKVIWVTCPKSSNGDHEKPYKGAQLSTEKSLYVNAGGGVMVKFPPIEIVDENSKAYGWVKTLLHEEDLPAALLPEDFFEVGVDVQIINAVIPEGEVLTVEFYISGWEWDNTFAVLFWNVEAEEWVEIPSVKEPHPRLPGGKVIAEWTEPGIFVLVTR